MARVSLRHSPGVAVSLHQALDCAGGLPAPLMFETGFGSLHSKQTPCITICVGIPRGGRTSEVARESFSTVAAYVDGLMGAASVQADALTIKFRQILKKIVDAKTKMGSTMKTSAFALTEAKYAAGEQVRACAQVERRVDVRTR